MAKWGIAEIISENAMSRHSRKNALNSISAFRHALNGISALRLRPEAAENISSDLNNKASDARWRAEHLSARQRLASAGVVELAVPAPKVLWLGQ